MKKTSTRLTALALVLALLLTACANGASATAMRLRKTEGTVGVADGKGKDIEPREDLGLYSGYGVDTSSESYAWIDLDEVKLTKLDQNSEIAIAKEGKALEIEVKSGALFFNVTEPLAGDESMNIRTSTMVIGIRGTCGWVHMEDDELMYVYLLRGKVECSVLGENGSALAAEMLTAGQMAKMTLSGDAASIVIEDFSQQDIPAFVMPEIEEDAEILDSIPPEEPDPAEAPDDSQEDNTDVPGDQTEEDAGQTNADILAQYKEILAQGESYTYNSDADKHTTGMYANSTGYKYALYQESGFSVPTLILMRQGVDRHGYLLFRYDPDTGTTSQVGSDTATRFEMPSHSFFTEISINNDWHDFTDTGYLESQLS